MMHYLDTSVLTAYYCVERGSKRVQAALRRIEGPTVSPLVEVEFHCAVARKVRAGEIDRSTAHRIFSEFRLHLDEPRYRVVHIEPVDYGLARDWIAHLATPLRVLDALHLATAFANDLVLVTADRDLAASARHFGVKRRLLS